MLHLYFAPLEGITTYPYRNLHHKYFGGVDKYFTPFLAPGPEQGMSVKEMRDVLPENNAGVPVVPQILTNRAGDFLLASKKLAEMGYREINLRGIKLVKNGGYLATCSCSHFATEELFLKMLRSAAKDAGVQLRQIEARQQCCDHPILWGVEETNYLKFYLFQVV